MDKIVNELEKVASALTATGCTKFLSKTDDFNGKPKNFVFYHKISDIARRLQKNGGWFWNKQDAENVFRLIRNESNTFDGNYKGRMNSEWFGIVLNEPQGCVVTSVVSYESAEVSSFGGRYKGEFHTGGEEFAEGKVYYFDGEGLLAVDEIQYKHDGSLRDTSFGKYHQKREIMESYKSPVSLTREFERKERKEVAREPVRLKGNSTFGREGWEEQFENAANTITPVTFKYKNKSGEVKDYTIIPYKVFKTGKGTMVKGLDTRVDTEKMFFLMSIIAE